MAAALAAEGFYFLGQYGVTSAFGPYYRALTGGDSPFLPTVIPFNIAVIACAYLAGVALVRPNRSRATKAVVRTSVDDAYGVYLAHLLVLNALMWLGWGKLLSVIPWPVLILLTVAIVFAFCVPLTELLARTPLATPLTGRRQVPWHKAASRRPDPLGSPGGQAGPHADRDWCGRGRAVGNAGSPPPFSTGPWTPTTSSASSRLRPGPERSPGGQIVCSGPGGRAADRGS